MQNIDEQGQSPKNGMNKKNRKSSRFLYRLLGVVILISVVLAVELMAKMSFTDVKAKDYFKTDIRRLEKENAQVDMIIAGASQIYHGCNPDIISKEMGIGEVIDCASASASKESIYYMVKDILERFEPKYVVFDLVWNAFIPSKDDWNLHTQILASEQLSLKNRIQFYINCVDISQWPNLSDMYCYGSTVWGISQLISNFKNRLACFRGDWGDPSTRLYQKNGFRRFDRSRPKGNIPAQRKRYSSERVSEYERSYLEKTIEMCREKGVKPFLITTPVSMAETYGVENFQEAIDDIKEFAREMDCDYFNFSLMKNQETLFPDQFYTNSIHLNMDGAERFSKLLSEVLTKTLNGEDVSSMFYEDIDSMKKDVTRIVAANGTLHYEEDGSVRVDVFSFQNEDITPEYRLVLTDEKKKEGGTDEKTQETENGNNDSIGTDHSNDSSNGNGEGNDNGDEEGQETANDEGREDGSTDGIELRPWQTETVFTLDSSELISGKNLRLEVRKAGESTVEAYQENILDHVI